jgi:hypothetical protein
MTTETQLLREAQAMVRNMRLWVDDAVQHNNEYVPVHHSTLTQMLDHLAALSAPAQPASGEAVGEYVTNIDKWGGILWRNGPPPHGTKLYTAPQPAQPAERVAMTDGELWLIWNEQGSDEMNQQEAIAFARAVEAHHGITSNGATDASN